MKDLAIMSFTPGPGINQRTILFGIGSPRIVSGVDRLCQEIIMRLNQTPGSDILNPNSGGNFKLVAGRTMDVNMVRSTLTMVSSAVSAVESQIIASQAKQSLPDSERLLKLTVLDASFIKLLTTLVVNIQVMNAQGTIQNIGLTL